MAATAQRVLAAVVAGLVLGLFSAIGDGLPPDTPLHVVVALANAAGPWLAAAFAVGALQERPRAGAIAGLLTVAIAIGTYYAAIYAGGHEVANLAGLLASWLAIAAVAGPLLGAAGAAWARSRGRLHVLGLAILCGGLLAEAAFRFIQIEGWTGIDLGRSYWQIAIVDLLGAVALPLLFLERARRREGYAWTLLTGAVGLAVIAGITAAL